MTTHAMSIEDSATGLVLITGLAGAGYSTAIDALQDAGYLAIDNLPVALLGQLVSTEIEAAGKKVAVSVDTRLAESGAGQMQSLLADIRKRLAGRVVMVHLTASKEEVFRRYNATRRRHPLNTSGEATGLTEAIELDWERNRDLAGLADAVIDTSHSDPAAFKQTLLAQLGIATGAPIPMVVESFSYRNGIPASADMVLDMRFLDNPHWVPELAGRTGEDGEVQAHIKKDEAFAAAMDSIMAFLAIALPRLTRGGRPRFCIATGCTGGRHRSVFAAITIAARLEAMGHAVRLRHRDL